MPSNLTGYIYTEMHPDAAVEDVLNELQRRHVIPQSSNALDLYILYPPHSNAPLLAGQTLGDVGFQDGSHLHVYWRRRGGMPPGSSSMPGHFDKDWSGASELYFHATLQLTDQDLSDLSEPEEDESGPSAHARTECRPEPTGNPDGGDMSGQHSIWVIINVRLTALQT